MAGTYDTEEQRIIDRIRCIAFRQAQDAGATFINRNWIAEKIHRPVRFITDWWQKPYDDQCFADYSNAGPKLKLSQASDRERKSGPSGEFYAWIVRRPNYQIIAYGRKASMILKETNAIMK
ncbi:unnamed protein product [Adineta ricciae]|uniref:Uncharacterized protein n=1 Tax=Adineta ricciae TaxID=249248 RepID=A0A815U9S0_ADIRI|nr:unnamed protein product [Adineta ricciae]CAF1538853.1 unnamed protein product [Adineta ricciae]